MNRTFALFSPLVAAMALSTAYFAVAEAPEAAAASAETAAASAAKSIVPSKYAGKYKNGGSGPVPEFIKSQAYENNALVLESFWSLCTVNGLPEDKIAHYKGLVADKAQGAAGKARMTLGNMLAAKARKDGFLLNQAGEKVELDVPKPALGGAAAKAAENAAANAGNEAGTKADGETVQEDNTGAEADDETTE